MAKQLLLALSILAFSTYGFAKPKEEPSVKVNIAVNTDKGSTHESVALVKEDGKWKPLKDRNGGARQMNTYPKGIFNNPCEFSDCPPDCLCNKGAQPAARSLDTKSRMFSAFLGPVCTECSDQNAQLFIQCLRKLRKEESDYKKCFKQLLERDDNRDDEKKCATCVCKEFKNSGVDVDAYPEIKDMFCFSGQAFDYCRDDDVTSDNEHYPKCGKGLMCDTSTKSWGFCKEATCDDTSKDAVDKLELNCNQYEGLDICDRSDELKDEDFEARKMCCACGGGSVPKKDIVKYDEPLTAKWCKLNKDVEGRNGCMDDKQCLDNARGQCDKDPDCYGVSWYPNNIGQKLKLCLSRDMDPKNDGWRTIMKLQAKDELKPCASVLDDDGLNERTIYKNQERSHGVQYWSAYLYVYPGCLFKAYVDTNFRGTMEAWSYDDVRDWSNLYAIGKHKWLNWWWQNDIRSFKCYCYKK